MTLQSQQEGAIFFFSGSSREKCSLEPGAFSTGLALIGSRMRIETSLAHAILCVCVCVCVVSPFHFCIFILTFLSVVMNKIDNFKMSHESGGISL